MPTATVRAGTDQVFVVLIGRVATAHAGLFLSLESGLFMEARLDVRLRSAERWMEAVEALERRRDDFGLISADELMVARAQGADLVSVLALDAPAAGHYDQVLVTRRSNLSERRELIDRFVGVTIAGYRRAAVSPTAAVDAVAMADSDVDRATVEREMAGLVKRWSSSDPPGLQVPSGFGMDGSLTRGAMPFDNGPALLSSSRPPAVPTRPLSPSPRASRD